MNAVASGLSTFGRINAVIGCVVMTIVSIIMTIIGVHLIRSPPRTGKTNGKITNVENNKFRASYTVNGQPFTLNGTSSSYGVGDDVNIVYNVNNPTDSRLSTQLSDKKIGMILILIAVVLAGITYISTYFMFKSKTYSTIMGGLDLAGDARSLL